MARVAVPRPRHRGGDGGSRGRRMRSAYDAVTVRAAEQPLLDALPEGALMQRAAFALARRCAAVLDRVYGSRVVLLVGSGGNGGDAMYAGARLAARGARV